MGIFVSGIFRQERGCDKIDVFVKREGSSAAGLTGKFLFSGRKKAVMGFKILYFKAS